jgi:hypothetical protein
MHPQRPALRCPYHNLSECNLAVPDKEAQEIQIEMAIGAKHFWDEHEKKNDARLHICDIPLETLKEKHRHVLELIPKHDPVLIGLLIAGKYYKDVWASRSCSGHLANLVGTGDYLDFYCSSSCYFMLETTGNPIATDFTKADVEDGGV